MLKDIELLRAAIKIRYMALMQKVLALLLQAMPHTQKENPQRQRVKALTLKVIIQLLPEQNLTPKGAAQLHPAIMPMLKDIPLLPMACEVTLRGMGLKQEDQNLTRKVAILKLPEGALMLKVIMQVILVQTIILFVLLALVMRLIQKVVRL